MAELVAQGNNRQRRVWRDLPEGQSMVLGRAPRNGLDVPWDPLISREHARICLRQGELAVEQLDTARNPILVGGRTAKNFSVAPHEEFRIGETTFRFQLAEPAEAETPTVVEHTLLQGSSPQWFVHAQTCLQALCEMPTLIADARDDADFAVRVAELLLRSLPDCAAVAVVQFDFDAATRDEIPEPKLIRWNARDDSLPKFRPSRRLMDRAFQQQRSVVHLWCADAGGTEFTMAGDLDWAFCTPIPTAANEKWCLYVSGRREFRGMRDVQSPDDLLSDLRLAELMARFIGSVRQVRTLERHQAEVRQFLSPAVVEALMSDRGWASLDPHEGQVTALFCDVRGFAHLVEQSSDKLDVLLRRVREALSAMTRGILRFEGVIADFQGDAALGFWGWPTEATDAPLLACRAALMIHSTFEAAQSDPTHPLYGFHVGIGVGHGNAIAGRIGSEEQVKVGVFGPVVNLASRLQDLTKLLQTPILLDEAAAKIVAPQLSPYEAQLRRICSLRPPGIFSPVSVYSLIPAGRSGFLSADEHAAYGDAVTALEAGRWSEAAALLAALPDHDGPSRFLLRAIDDFGGHPPDDWDGTLTMAGKDSHRMFAQR